MKILEVVPYLSTASIAAGQNEIICQTAAGHAGRSHQVSVYTSDEQLHHDLIRQLKVPASEVVRVVWKANCCIAIDPLDTNKLKKAILTREGGSCAGLFL